MKLVKQPKDFTAFDWANFAVRTAVTLALLIGGLWVLLRDTYPDGTVKWAMGAVGLGAGYWLR
jgi:hypothetical protein